jgi:hypothetical protein
MARTTAIRERGSVLGPGAPATKGRRQESGVELPATVDPDSKAGPASITLLDPHDNPGLIDQVF